MGGEGFEDAVREGCCGGGFRDGGGFGVGCDSRFATGWGRRGDGGRCVCCDHVLLVEDQEDSDHGVVVRV